MSQPKSKLLGRIILTFVVVVLPAMSFFYLRSGLNYRKTTLSELRDLGGLPVFGIQDISTNKFFTADSFRNQILLVSAPDPADAASVQSLVKLHKQFNDRNDVKLLMLFRPPLPNERFMPPVSDPGQILISHTDDYAALRDSFGLTNRSHNIAYFDYKGRLRQTYNLTDPEAMKRLAAHVAMLLPVKPKDTVTIRDNKL